MHPLAPDLSQFNNDELLQKFNDLNKKIVLASRSGSGHVVHQMSMLLEDYRQEMRRRHEKLMSDATKNPNFKNIIDIQ
jgi:hypothetical protein